MVEVVFEELTVLLMVEVVAVVVELVVEVV
jgi:hypothetical protein